MKDILLITNYWHFKVEKESSRYLFLAEMISQETELSLEIVTSSFYHATKKQRKYNNDFLDSFEYKVSLINEPGYKKNISFRRLYSHNIFARNVLKYLKKRKRPDLIYLVVPSLDVADKISKYADQQNIPLIVDIQDLWPEAFKMAIDIPVISDVLFYPMMKKANRIYSRAERILAVSNTYVQRGLRVNKKDDEGLSVYIGTDLKYANYCIDKYKNIRTDSRFWITYVGALGYSYDIKLIIDAIEKLNEKGIENILFNVLGDGPLRKEFEQYANEKKVCTNFMGMVEYPKMMGILASSNVAVNPIVKKSVSSIINKVGDYAAAGIPVINTQNSNEYRSLLDEYGAGINCNTLDDVVSAIELLYIDKEKQKSMAIASKKIGEQYFDRNVTYRYIIKCIKDLTNGGD
mgnify:CR=1 FL=1